MRRRATCRCGPALVLFLALAGCAGCAPASRITPAARSAIRTLHVAETVSLPQRIAFDQPPPLLSPSPVISLDEAKDGARLEETMRANGIDLGQIVREAFCRELGASREFALVDSEPADARLELEVVLAAFGPTNGLVYRRRRPHLLLRVRLIRLADNALLLTRQRVVTSMNQRIPAHTVEELARDPALIREGFAVAAQILSERLVRDLQP